MFVEPNLKNHLPANFITDCSENSTMDFVLFYQKIINIISAKDSPILLFRIGYSVTPNPIVHMTNVISYYEAWRFLPVAELPWPRAQLLTPVEILNPKYHIENEETRFEPVDVPWGFEFNCRTSSESSISLSTNTDCNEQRAATTGQRDIRVLLSCCKKILTVKETLLGSVSFTIS